MALHWAWTWSIGLPNAAYINSGWSINGASISTKNGTNLGAPVTPGIPGDEYNCLIDTADDVTTPAFPGGAITAGWVLVRLNYQGTWSNSPARNILKLMNGVSTKVEIRASAAAASSTLAVYVNGTLVGTSSAAVGGSEDYIAVKFNGATPSAGLTINGVEEVALASSGAAFTIDRIQLGTSNGPGYYGDIAVFDSLADLTDAETQDVWVAFLTPDAVTDGDASWTPSATTDLGDVSDGDETTYTETTTDPDTINVAVESPDDRSSGWSPQTVYGAQAVVYATADVITSATLTLDDGAGTADTEVATLNSTGSFVVATAPQTSGAVAWTVPTLNLANLDFAVSS